MTRIISTTSVAENVLWHSWATTACHANHAGRKGPIVAAKVIASTGIDLFTNSNLIEESQNYFRNATEGKPYQSPLPVDQDFLIND